MNMKDHILTAPRKQFESWEKQLASLSEEQITAHVLAFILEDLHDQYQEYLEKILSIYGLGKGTCRTARLSDVSTTLIELNKAIS